MDKRKKYGEINKPVKSHRRLTDSRRQKPDITAETNRAEKGDPPSMRNQTPPEAKKETEYHTGEKIVNKDTRITNKEE